MIPRAALDALALVERYPRQPLGFLAAKLRADVVELELRLLAAARAGLAQEVSAGCGSCPSAFVITPAGLALLRESGA